MNRTITASLATALGIMSGCATQHAPSPAVAMGDPPTQDTTPAAAATPPTFPVVDYAQEWVRLNEEALPPEGRLWDAENAWPLFVQWLKDFRREEALAFGWSPTERESFKQQSPDEMQDSPFISLYIPADPTDTTADATMSQAVAGLGHIKKTDLLPRLQRLAAMRRVVRPKETRETLVGASLSELSAIRGAARMETARLAQCLEKDDSAGAVDAMSECLSLARLARYEPMLIGAYVAVAVEGALFSALEERAAGLLNSPTELQRAALVLQDHVACTPPWSYTVRSELTMVKDAIQNTYKSFGEADAPTPGQMITLVGSVSEMDDDAVEVMRRSTEGFKARSESVQLAEKLYGLISMALESPHYARQTVDLSKAVKDAEDNMVLSVVLMNIDGTFRTADANRADVAGIRLMLAVEQYGVKHQALPEKLADVVPEFLNSVPIDPFDATGFKYKRVDTTASPRGYLLYSIGLDGVDNGGKQHPTTNRWALSAREGVGYDYVIVGPSPE